MTLLKVAFVVILTVYLVRASRNLLLAVRRDSGKLSDRDDAGGDDRGSRHAAPHETVEDARWEDL
jgi:hypothetical protein